MISRYFVSFSTFSFPGVTGNSKEMRLEVTDFVRVSLLLVCSIPLGNVTHRVTGRSTKS